MYRATQYPEDIANLIAEDALSGWAEVRKQSRWIAKGPSDFHVDPDGWIWAKGIGDDGVQWFWRVTAEKPKGEWYTFSKVQGEHGSGKWMEP